MIVNFQSDKINDRSSLTYFLDTMIEFANSKISCNNNIIIDTKNKFKMSENFDITSVVGIPFMGLRYDCDGKYLTYKPRKIGPSMFLIKKQLYTIKVYCPGYDQLRGIKFYDHITALYSGVSKNDYKILEFNHHLHYVTGKIAMSIELWNYVKVISNTLSIEKDGTFVIGNGEYMFNFLSPDGINIIKFIK